MVRAYAARLGCIAFAFVLMRNILSGGHIEQALMSSLGFLLIFSVVGFVIGSVVETMIRQSVEANFRHTVEKYHRRPEKTAVEQN
ncbi:MAG: hypothetical protein SGI77_21105 [Pirellulaceae bacterium]|nr:hypothetical protein [Pirellulaceae bacterium]